MDYEILKILAQFGGGTAILVALCFVLKAIADLVKARNGNGKFGELQKIVTNDIRHELDRIWASIDKINERLDNFEVRLIKLEVNIKNNKS